MTDTEPRERDFDSAVSKAVLHVAETRAAQEEARARQKPKRRPRYLAAALVGLTAVAIWNVWLLQRPPEGLPPEIVAAHLRFTVGTLVREVEFFAYREGRFPTRDELLEGQFLDEGTDYALVGEGADVSYMITAWDGDLRVTYDGATELDEWVSTGGGN